MPPYACRLIEENYQAIASEKPGFDIEEARVWVEIHGSGFFIRDEEMSSFDCTYVADVVFHTVYAFDGFREYDIFHRLLRK